MLSLTTLAAGAADAEPGFWRDPETWVYVALTLFFLIFGAKIWAAITGALDARIADTRKALDEAEAIRAEAEALLAAAHTQTAASAAEAAAILHTARAEAEGILAKADIDAAATIQRRERMANDKIGAAERAAIEHIRAKAGNAAIAVATDVIRADHRADNDRDLVSGAIAGM